MAKMTPEAAGTRTINGGKEETAAAATLAVVTPTAGTAIAIGTETASVKEIENEIDHGTTTDAGGLAPDPENDLCLLGTVPSLLREMAIALPLSRLL